MHERGDPRRRRRCADPPNARADARGRGVPGGDCCGRRRRAGRARAGRSGLARPRCWDARRRRARRLSTRTRAGPRDADPDSDRAGLRLGPCRRPRCGCRRLPRETVRHRGAARARPRAAASRTRAGRAPGVRRSRLRGGHAHSAAWRARDRAERARGRSPRAAAAQPASGRHARDRACTGVGQCVRRELEQRRPVRLVPPAQARRALADRDRAGRGLRPRALTVRSLLGRSVVAAVGGILLAVVVAGAGVDVLASRDLHRTLDRSLRQRAVEISQLSASAPALLTRAGALDTTLRGTQLRVEVLDRRNRLVARSLALGGRVLPVGRMAAQAIASGRGSYATTSVGGDRLRIYAAPLADFGGPAAGGAVVVAASERDMDRTLGNLHLFLILAGLVAAALAALSVFLLLRRPLRPVT